MVPEYEDRLTVIIAVIESGFPAVFHYKPGEQRSLAKESYQIGFALGRHWAIRDATSEQLRLVRALGAGQDWVANHTDPAKEFTRIVDPGKSDFLGTGADPSADFVAGFIDGAQAIES